MERNITVWLPLVPPTGDLAHNPGMCRDCEWNRQPFGSQAGAQFTEPHQPGWILIFFRGSLYIDLDFSWRSLVLKAVYVTKQTGIVVRIHVLISDLPF